MKDLNGRISTIYEAIGSKPPEPVYMPELDEATRKMLGPLLYALKQLPLPQFEHEWKQLRVSFLKSGDTLYISSIEVHNEPPT